jgi:hypothetical protein
MIQRSGKEQSSYADVECFHTTRMTPSLKG